VTNYQSNEMTPLGLIDPQPEVFKEKTHDEDDF